MKLFNVTFADYALFGKKDYQQFRVIERMISDLCFPIHILGSETVREDSGLALSSRNRFLEKEHLEMASKIFKGLIAARGFYQGGERATQKLIELARETIVDESDFEIEYLEICDQMTLEPCGETVDRPPVMLVAGKIGGVRLIDNLELDAGT
jgi:pantoate--beta-alanine ligase